MTGDGVSGTSDGPPELLAREARSLVTRLRLWTPARFAAALGDGTRGDRVHHLAAALVELGGEAPGPLPRLSGDAADLALPDQLAVAADDLARTAPAPAVARAATAHVLLHRGELLGDDVPAGLLAGLGLAAPGELRSASGCPLPPA